MMDFQLQRLNNRPLGEGQVFDWEIARWICLGAFFLALILTYAWLHTEILNIHYLQEQVKKENSQLSEANAALRVEYSVLTNPDEIDRRARQLGLVSAHDAQVRILESDAPLLLTAQNRMAELRSQKKNLNE